MVVQRIGQEKFRDALMLFWSGRCPMTGITDPALLRASHIIPWADCATDAAAGMISYYWSAIIGTERSIGFAASLRQEGFVRFEEALEEFRLRFDDRWLRA